jgi:phospholipid transport system substrate-binding protein
MLVRVFRMVALLAAVITGLSLGGTPARAADPTSFVQGMADQALSIIKNQSVPQAQRKAAFSTLFNSNFDVPTIGKFVLGIYWRRATSEQQADYLKVFGQYVVAVYADRFSNYTGVTFKVTGMQQTSSDSATVASVIDRGNGAPPVHVSWVLIPNNGGYKIVDVMVENLSMRLTQRDEFSSVVEHNGGNVQSLIDLLKQKVQQG